MSRTLHVSHISRGPVRVLVADSDEEARLVYRESLRLAGCDVVDAADGREALAKALSVRPTLVITETQLPGFDGFALCEVLRRDSMTRGVPILVVTTETRLTELDRARDAGADVVLIKPVTPDALLNEIQRLVRHQEQSNALAHGGQADDSPSERPNAPLSKAHPRFETRTPPKQPPHLVCPSCDARLTYDHSHIGGVSGHYPEQWDYYTCPESCGATFVYRQRTRKLRQV